MVDREEEGVEESAKMEYIKNEKSFFGKIKGIFHKFWSAFFCWNI